MVIDHSILDSLDLPPGIKYPTSAVTSFGISQKDNTDKITSMVNVTERSISHENMGLSQPSCGMFNFLDKISYCSFYNKYNVPCTHRYSSIRKAREINATLGQPE